MTHNRRLLDLPAHRMKIYLLTHNAQNSVQPSVRGPISERIEQHMEIITGTPTGRGPWPVPSNQ
jgi:hypothetical protein